MTDTKTKKHAIDEPGTMATSTETVPADMESELHYLRQQNKQLQFKLEKLMSPCEDDKFSNENDSNRTSALAEDANHNYADSSGAHASATCDPGGYFQSNGSTSSGSASPSRIEFTRSLSDPINAGNTPTSQRAGRPKRNSPPPKPAMLHHRRGVRREEDCGSLEMTPNRTNTRTAASFSPSGRSIVKAKISDVDLLLSTNGNQLNLPRSGKEEEEFEHTNEQSNLLATEDPSDDENRRVFLISKSPMRKTRDGGGNYSKALSLDNDSGDEEECRRLELHIPDDEEDEADESDDLIDDDSHNKHQPPPKPPLCGNSCSSVISSSSANSLPSFQEAIKERGGWLIGLLVLQSCSSFIIQYNEGFLQKHMVIVQFLTMLVGAGGNAGNQASVRVIRELALGTLNERTMKPFLRQEAKMAFGLSALLGLTGFIRAALFRTPPGETIAVTTSLCAIVTISVGIGSTLPLGMKKVGIDPAHSSTTIQVLMDILGVLITVSVSSIVLSMKAFRIDEDGRDPANGALE